MFVLAHVSDLHATPLEIDRLSDLANKRLLAWLSWRAKRRDQHRGDVLHALLEDLENVGPDHVAVTGDLTNAALPSEFRSALPWLEGLGGPEQVSLVPGNHDAYVRVERERCWDLWAPYLGSDLDPQAPFPSLRVRGPLAVVGLCSAAPTPPLLATGRLGAEQLERLEKRLTDLADTALCRVVLVHHPPVAGAVSRRRALRDAAALRDVLARCGADLVLHGHAHRSLFDSVPGPDAPIPVVGVRSASYAGGHDAKRAQYHLYEIEREERGSARPRFRIRTRVRGFDPASGRFVAERDPQAREAR
ncbi:MAG: metallophosphoesterase [Myxococcota bacterium]|nr:metallophosphoesterase [Myxococcota bacterium]